MIKYINGYLFFPKVSVYQGENVILKFLGAHNSESRTTKLLSMLIDNTIVLDAGCITSELSYQEQEQIKAILLSHGHYDHIRSIPSYAFNNFSKTTPIYASHQTHQILSSHLIDGVIYPKFNEKTSFTENKPLNQVTIKGFQSFEIDGYTITPIPVNHIEGSFGYEVISEENKRIFFTGDTGPGLQEIWKKINPELLVIDLTFPNRLMQFAKDAQHLCPELLKKELVSFQKMNGYLPRIVLIHLSPRYEDEIREEISQVSEELDHPIDIAVEGRSITI